MSVSDRDSESIPAPAAPGTVPPATPGTATPPGQVALDRFRKKAKALLESAQNGDAAVLARLAAVPRLKDTPPSDLATMVQLADAQYVVAREAGAESWPKLKAMLDALDPETVAAGQFLLLLADRQFEKARAILAAHPAIPGQNLFTAAATGDLAALEKHLAAATSPSPTYPHNKWTPLLYVAGSPFHADAPDGPERFAEAARRLLDAGASANEHTIWTEDEGKSTLSALYRAVIGNNVPVARLLLERGANPNDGESIYHGAELNHVAMLELLLAHGAEISKPDPHWGNTPLYFLSGYFEGAPPSAILGMRWLLEHGADPNQPSGENAETPLHQLVRNHREPEVLALLLDHGADPNAARADGITPYRLAVQSGHDSAARLLESRGAIPEGVTAFDRFLGAAMDGRTAEARGFLDRGEVSLADLTGEQRGLLAHAANAPSMAAVDALLDVGFDLAWESEWGGTALHWVAWHGKVEMVKHLLERGAPVNIRDKRFGSSPLAWAGHGSQNCRQADDDYMAIIDLLLAAGSDRETSFNGWNEPPEALSSARVAAHLKKRLAATTS
ncbi:MAG TPA: ankyrin repeat domain-containing protein [Candidatus Eisenbacteria bacterium]